VDEKRFAGNLPCFIHSLSEVSKNRALRPESRCEAWVSVYSWWEEMIDG
jgi:hypothetical protein